MNSLQTTETTEPAPAKLLYQSHDGNALALPQWAQTFLLLGETIVRWDDDRTRIIAGIALPTRAYASLMIGTGIVLEREKIKIIDTAANFQTVTKLPVGTALLYNVNGKSLHAAFDGTQVVHGELRLRVRVQKRSAGGGTYLLDAKQALALQVLVGIDGESALSNRVHRTKNSQQLFLKNLLPHTEPDEFLLYSRLDCLIIGTIVTLRNEMALRLASNGWHGMQLGTFQDILKIQRFSSPGHTYRSEVMAVGSEALPDNVTPYASLFDGALSFLKWRETWRQTHWIVVLDRTEPHFAEAVSILNQEYISDRIDAEQSIVPRLPDGMDVLLFKERQ